MSGLISYTAFGEKSGLLGATPAFFAYGFASSPSSAHGTIPFNQTRYNIGGHYNTSAYNFTAPVKGLYGFTLNISLNGVNDSTAYFGFNFIVGGASNAWQWIWENSKAHDYWSQTTSRQFEMGPGDTRYVSLNGSGTGQFGSIRGGQNDSTFSGYLITPYITE